MTRTLLLSKLVPDMLLVSRGSGPNVDPEALDKATAVSTIKAFNIANATAAGYSYINDGLLMGWGLRNSVGVAEDPASGAIYSVENSVDNIARAGQVINQDNPGEELNFHGYLNGTATREQGATATRRATPRGTSPPSPPTRTSQSARSSQRQTSRSPPPQTPPAAQTTSRRASPLPHTWPRWTSSSTPQAPARG